MGTYQEDLYTKPWTRFGPYIVGIFLGYLLHMKTAFPKRNFKLPKLIVLAGWIISTISAVAIIFGPRDFFDPANTEETLHSATSAFYAGIHRYAWGVVISWIIFACCSGYGGWVNDFLSWKVFIPLGRLTFTVYITSYHLQMIYHLSLLTPQYFSIYSTVSFSLQSLQ